MSHHGGADLYRATAECSACARTVDVGPFLLGDLQRTKALQAQLPGWLLTTHGPASNWALIDASGYAMTLCDECMAKKPLGSIIAAITERNRS